MEVLYHDLKVDVVDRDKYKSSLSQQLKSAINNKFMLRRANPPDAKTPAISISVRRQSLPGASFLRLLWSNLRYGLVETIAS
jgi:hypothetical protein